MFADLEDAEQHDCPVHIDQSQAQIRNNVDGKSDNVFETALALVQKRPNTRTDRPSPYYIGKTAP